MRPILVPPTFHIASLNRYTPKFSGKDQKLTGSQLFVLQVLPKWDDADFCHLEKVVFRRFFYKISFSGKTVYILPNTQRIFLVN